MGWEKVRDPDAFVYRPEISTPPLAIDAMPSQECIDYHKNSKVQFIVSEELYEKFQQKHTNENPSTDSIK